MENNEKTIVLFIERGIPKTTKIFSDIKKAESFFGRIMREKGYGISSEDIEDALDNGYWEYEGKDLYIYQAEEE